VSALTPPPERVANSAEEQSHKKNAVIFERGAHKLQKDKGTIYHVLDKHVGEVGWRLAK